MQKKKTKSIIATLLTLIIGFIYQNYFAPQANKESHKSREANTTRGTRGKELILTKHARCRMECRHIDMQEIKMVLGTGKVNHRKSEPSKKPCPVFAREAYSKKDKQRIRVISADCADKQTIITVIDLSNEYNCYCK